MTYFLLLIVGFISAHRIMYRFEKFFFISRKKSISLFVLLTFPLYLFAFIKEHMGLLMIYIGLFLLSLIFFFIIFEKKLKNTFILSHLNVIDGLLLQIRAGYSTQKALSESFMTLKTFENIIFEPLQSILRPDFDIKLIRYGWTSFYFLELRQILKSETRLIEQLEAFKQGLKIKNKFIQRTRQVSRQIKAQAVVACVVYGLIFTLAYYQLDLMSSFSTVLGSILLFLTGIFIIFQLGGRIKWRI